MNLSLATPEQYAPPVLEKEDEFDPDWDDFAQFLAEHQGDISTLSDLAFLVFTEDFIGARQLILRKLQEFDTRYTC